MSKVAQNTSPAAILAFVVVLAAGLGIAMGNKQRDEGKSTPIQNDTEEQITLELYFGPPFRNDRSIKVEAFVEGVDILQAEGETAKYPGLSGWSRTFPVPKGAEVIFSGWSKHGTFLQCFIKSNGEEVNKDKVDEQIAEAQVNCKYKKKL